MRFLKNPCLLPLAALALTLLTPAANAQNATTYPAWNGGTNGVSANATNSPGLTQACSEFDNVGIQIFVYAPAGATNGTDNFKFALSADSTNYETTPSINIPIVPTQTNFTFYTNLSIPSAATIKFVSAAHTNAGAVLTNIAVKYRFKAPKVKAL